MGSRFWYIPVCFVIWKAAFFLSSSIMLSAKLGGIEDPSKWYHWAVFAVSFLVLEFIATIISDND